MRRVVRVLLTTSLAAALSPASAFCQKPDAQDRAWIAKSNSYTNQILQVQEKYSPEFASSQGLTKFDTKVGDPSLATEQSARKEMEGVVARLIKARDSEQDPNVRQDLEILIHQEQLGFRQQDYGWQNEVPYINATSYVFFGLQPLLDDQASGARHHAAIERLKRYVGMDPDGAGNSMQATERPSMGRSLGDVTAPGTSNYQDAKALYRILLHRIVEQGKKPNMIWPSRQEVETQLGRNATMMEGIKALFLKYKLTGWEDAYAQLQKQMAIYDDWVRNTMLPHCRSDFRLPAEEYALAFEGYGIDIPPAQIAEMAHKAFTDYQAQMAPIAAEIAKERGYKSADYRDVIRELKKQQITGEAILPFYEKRLGEIEGIIKAQKLVALPDRPAIIRLASPAETAQQPAPHMIPPPFLNNTGQRGVFVLPLNMPAEMGKSEQVKVDDYTFDAASWTLISHEARPGHELQFDSMVEHGVSQARALYAFNSTNAEGWGLYAEYIMLPFMPKEGQLISLQFRLLRAARAYLDPELQEGKVTPAEALKVLTDQVCMSVPFATQEVERYTFRSPGQANSYFYGFTRLLELRKETEEALGPKFDAFRFHNFILAQGLLPPGLMKKAVEENFIPAEKAR